MDYVRMVHLLAAVIWVGGMFFAYVFVRPVTGQILERQVRLQFWSALLSRFLSWVGLLVLILLGSGVHMLFSRYESMGQSPLYIHLMTALGVAMALVYGHLYMAPFRRFRQNVTGDKWEEAEDELTQIRLMIGINLLLGLVVIVIAGGRLTLG